MFLQIIADYGTGDPAFGEVIQKLKGLFGRDRFQLDIHCTSVPKFSTLATGFWIGQYSLVNPIVNEMAVYANTAPRRDNRSVRDRNEGEKLLVAFLKNYGVVISVNAGWAFSFVKPHINGLYEVNTQNKGSQFRSRDFYPESVIGILRFAKGSEAIGKQISTDVIPDIPQNRIAWIDGYGNMKTTMRLSECNFNEQPITIVLNGIKRTAFFTDGSFHVREGELAFTPGSSGGEDPFMEIFLRGLSANDEFKNPPVESEFYIERSS